MSVRKISLFNVRFYFIDSYQIFKLEVCSQSGLSKHWSLQNASLAVSPNMLFLSKTQLFPMILKFQDILLLIKIHELKNMNPVNLEYSNVPRASRVFHFCPKPPLVHCQPTLRVVHLWTHVLSEKS